MKLSNQDAFIQSIINLATPPQSPVSPWARLKLTALPYTPPTKRHYLYTLLISSHFISSSIICKEIAKSRAGKRYFQSNDILRSRESIIVTNTCMYDCVPVPVPVPVPVMRGKRNCPPSLFTALPRPVLFGETSSSIQLLAVSCLLLLIYFIPKVVS